VDLSGLLGVVLFLHRAFAKGRASFSATARRCFLSASFDWLGAGRCVHFRSPCRALSEAFAEGLRAVGQSSTCSPAWAAVAAAWLPRAPGLSTLKTCFWPAAGFMLTAAGLTLRGRVLLRAAGRGLYVGLVSAAQGLKPFIETSKYRSQAPSFTLQVACAWLSVAWSTR